MAMAGAIVLPLDPHRLLVMFHPRLQLDPTALHQELDLIEADEVNLFVAAHSDRWTFELPDRSRMTTLFVPPLPDDRVAIPQVARRSDPATGNIGELRRLHSPARWGRAWRVPGAPIDR